MGDLTANTREIQRVLRAYYENLYANKLNNLEEINKFLETKTPKIWVYSWVTRIIQYSQINQ